MSMASTNHQPKTITAPGRPEQQQRQQQQQQQPLPPPPAAQPARGAEKSSTSSPPFEFRGFDFFARRDLNDFREASRAYFAPRAAAAAAAAAGGTGGGGGEKSTDPASWLGDETPPRTPQTTLRGSTAAEGRFPIPAGGRTPRSEDGRSGRRCGLRKPLFWTLLAVVVGLFLLAVGVGVGVGVGDRSGNGSTAADATVPSSPDASGSPSSASSATATQTQTTTNTPTSSSATGAGGGGAGGATTTGCPGINGTRWQDPGSTKVFLRLCGLDYVGGVGAEAEATDIGRVPTANMLACMQNCAGTPRCTGCGWGVLAGDADAAGTDHTCWLKTDLGAPQQAGEDWSFAVLVDE
ncbi:hypothetical protein GGR56DRAFT_678179 [Xylariaceae sp. FL0804]|nr:hypothetical protein GGR56DRAFT_678179 [Xylariaceae sp. FL0804]